jgi:hypothetical protein
MSRTTSPARRERIPAQQPMKAVQTMLLVSVAETLSGLLRTPTSPV